MLISGVSHASMASAVWGRSATGIWGICQRWAASARQALPDAAAWEASHASAASALLGSPRSMDVVVGSLAALLWATLRTPTVASDMTHANATVTPRGRGVRFEFEESGAFMVDSVFALAVGRSGGSESQSGGAVSALVTDGYHGGISAVDR